MDPVAKFLALTLFGFGALALAPSQVRPRHGEDTPCNWSQRWQDEAAAKPLPCCPRGPPERLNHAFPEFPESDVGHWSLPIPLELVVEPDGTVEEVAFMRRPVFTPRWPEGEEAILETMRKWRYEPTVLDGERVPICMKAAIAINWS